MTRGDAAPKLRQGMRLATLLVPMTEQPTKPYPEVSAQANFPAMEKEILAQWQHDGTFRQSVE